jgi:hypothetical protein
MESGMVDRREHRRTEVSFETHVFVRGRLPTLLPCNVLDISSGGAKVQIGVPYALPRQVFLLRDERENIYECETVWQDEQTAGLAFVDLCARAKRDELLEEIETAEIVDWPS